MVHLELTDPRLFAYLMAAAEVLPCMTVLARRQPLPPPLKLSMDTQHCNREDPGDALGLGNEETHTVGNTTITKHLKAVCFAGLLTAPSIPKTVSACTHLQLNFCSSHQSCTQTKTSLQPGDCPAADSRTVMLSPEITLSLSRTGKEAPLSLRPWASNILCGMPGHHPLCG